VLNFCAAASADDEGGADREGGERDRDEHQHTQPPVKAS
jgi:hypothetical protein